MTDITKVTRPVAKAVEGTGSFIENFFDYAAIGGKWGGALAGIVGTVASGNILAGVGYAVAGATGAGLLVGTIGAIYQAVTSDEQPLASATTQETPPKHQKETQTPQQEVTPPAATPNVANKNRGSGVGK